MRKKGKGGEWERESDMGTAELVSLAPFSIFPFLTPHSRPLDSDEFRIPR